MHRIAILVGMAAWIGLSAGLWSLADSLTRPMPPGEVVNAVARRFPEASIVQAQLRRGTGVYKVKVQRATVGGHLDEWTMQVTLQGRVEKIERRLDAGEIPESVSRLIQNRFPRARVCGIREIATHGAPVRYEVRIAAPHASDLRMDCTGDGKIIEFLAGA